MTAPITDLSARLRAQQKISAEDALRMRRIVWPDGAIDPAEAEAIFDLNNAIRSVSREWVDFFVEAMSVYLVRQQSPQGYVDEAKAAWLMAKVDHDGRVDSLGELELLVKVLEDATSVPETLKTYALTQIEARYGVPKEVVLGVWGMETNYGSFKGDKDVIRSLATLAQVRYRGDFFRRLPPAQRRDLANLVARPIFVTSPRFRWLTIVPCLPHRAIERRLHHAW